MRINAVDITSQLIEENGLHEAYQVALNGVAEAVKSNDNFSLSVMHEVRASLPFVPIIAQTQANHAKPNKTHLVLEITLSYNCTHATFKFMPY